MNKFLLFLLGTSYIALMGFLAYKIFCYAVDRLLPMLIGSRKNAILTLLAIALLFLALGIIMFIDFINGNDDTDLAHYFPLMFVTSALLIWISVWCYRIRSR